MNTDWIAYALTAAAAGLVATWVRKRKGGCCDKGCPAAPSDKKKGAEKK